MLKPGYFSKLSSNNKE